MDFDEPKVEKTKYNRSTLIREVRLITQTDRANPLGAGHAVN
jgi:hypothetical protein